MPNSSLIVFGTWLAADGHLDEVVEASLCVAKFAKEHPQDLLSVYVLKGLPDHPNSNEVRTVSWFKSEQAYRNYIQSPVIFQAKIHCDNERLLQTPQYDRLAAPLAGFIRRETSHTDPYVVIASVRFKSCRRVDGARMFDKIAQAVEAEEPGALTYLFTADVYDENLMWVFERHENEEHLRKVHVPRDDVQRNMIEQHDIRQPGGLRHWYWKQIMEFQN